MKLLGIALMAGSFFVAGPFVATAGEFKVGMGRQVITPENPMWMAGYAARKEPASGKVHDLWAKAMVIEDETGARAAMVTTDLIGMPANIAHAAAALVQERLGIPRERLMLTASHTHCGPVIRDGLLNMYGLDDTQLGLMEAYTKLLPKLICAAVTQGVENLQPGTLSWGVGEAGFAGNRRKYTQGGVINDFNPIGVVDHDVPVLVAKKADGSITGILCGYACHNTTLDIQQFCGDYAGFAQIGIETANPGAVAMFAAGCGGDQNPYPRRTMELAQQHGKDLADAVLAVLNGQMAPVQGPLRAVYEEIPLKLGEPPTREQLEAQLQDQSVYVQRRAKHLLGVLDKEGALATTYPYPIQVWQFADTLQLTALAGEAVVDYSLRLKYELGREKQFVIAYANDCPAYIPSLRVLREGGYEGGESMIYYGLYGPWAPTVEEDIIATVREMSGK